MPAPGNVLNSLRVVRGQTKVLKVTVKTCEGRVSSLDGATLYFTVRERVGGPVLMRLKSPDEGIEITDAAKGEATITMSSTDTDITPGCYFHSLVASFEDVDPPIRHPVIKKSDFTVEGSLADFS